MAKTVTLTVKVDDAQFKQFVADFNAFSSQITGLNKQFSQINVNIQKATQSTGILSATMKGVLSTAKFIWTTAKSITGEFLKWSTIISAISALLGMGGGLWGIERLASSIMQKRRTVLGLGGDYGRTQATQVFGQTLMEDPGNVLKNIRMGLGGSTEQLGALQALGIPFGTKMKPEEVLPKVLERLQNIVKGAKPGTELAIAGAYGTESLGISPMDLTRLRDMSKEELKDLEEKIKAAGKEMSLSEKAQKGWSDLEIQFQNAKTQIETVFGEKLASLSKPLSDLSDSLVKLVKTLLDMPIVEKMIKQLTKWIENLSTYLQSADLEKDLKKFSDKVESWLPILTDLKDALVGFANAIRSIYRFLYPYYQRGEANPNAVTPPFGGNWPTNPNPRPTPNRPNVPVPGGTPTVPTPGSSGGASPYTPVPGAAPAPVSGANQQQSFFGAGSNQFASLNGGSSFAGGGGSSARFAAAGGNAFGGGNTQLAMGGNSAFFGGGRGGTNNLTAWSNAAGRSVPGPNDRGAGSQFAAFVGGGGGAGRGGTGPLDADNWQSTRTASLVIRNTPGTNPFVSATGMG
jgi:hypothetical protein